MTRITLRMGGRVVGELFCSVVFLWLSQNFCARSHQTTMKRATKFFLLAVLLTVSWVSIVFNYAPIKLDPKIYHIVKVVSLY